MKHIDIVSQHLSLEIGFTGDLHPAGLTEAIIEALEKGGVLEAAGIVYLKAEAPGHKLVAINLWAPDPVEEIEPPTIPEEEEKGLTPNV
ncbi:hypothetical protein LCGC14_0532570 [marine sediment metagenome]|uniref:Uncharacterized protein n=1 Tax=marine sediment metagenome TaxID=412755 RepID=A0A0F9V3G3_9ZZZZ